MTDSDFKPIPKNELDEIIERAEAKANEQSAVHTSIGVVSEDDLDEGEYAHVRPRYTTPRAHKNPDPIAVTKPKTYCDLCGFVDSHARGCPAAQPAGSDVEVVFEESPSIRRELKRIAAAMLKRVADRLEK